jgi:uncharacterized protein with HEPN domain
MSRNVELFVKDILRNMRDAEEFIQGLSYEQFAEDKKTFNAVVRAIEIVGEAAKSIPEELRAKYPAIPWREMAGMRDKVVHHYFGVDKEAVWIVAKERVPALKPVFEAILNDLRARG